MDFLPGRMEFSTFTFILTDRCNFRCSYCYQTRKNQRLSMPAITKMLDFIYPRLSRECYINFYGGEPLLAFDRIQDTIAHLEGLNRRRKRKIHYSLSTNGSLLSDEILGFLEEHAFFLLLSFDGWAQDICREKGSFDQLVSLIPEILKRKRISLETNSVFTPKTIGHLAASVRLLLRLGVPKFHIGLSSRRGWPPASIKTMNKEIAAVRTLIIDAYERVTDIPWAEMAKEPDHGIFRCDAGREKMALAADGRLWGCFLFPYLFDGKDGRSAGNKYCFGSVDSFLRDPEARYARTLSAIAGLGMFHAKTPEKSCVMCEDIESCWVCPIGAAFASGDVGAITSETCEMMRSMRKEQALFSSGFEKKKRHRRARIKAAGFL